MTKILVAWLPPGLVAVAVLALGGFALARPAGAAVNSLGIVPAIQTVPPDTTGITVSLEADATAPGIGTYDIDVLFNSTLLRATACTSNDADDVCNISTPGATNFTGKSAGGLTGSPLQLGTITFQTGATSGSSAIEVLVNHLTDPNGADITFPPPNPGEVVISPPTDADGDGFTNTAEASIGTGPEDPCGNDGWPAELTGGDNRLNIADLNSFLLPLRGDGSFAKFGHPVPDPQDPTIARWNLEVNGSIAIGDINALNPAVNAPTSRPPIFGGQPAFFTSNGECPFPP